MLVVNTCCQTLYSIVEGNGFQPVSHGPVVGHGAVFSGPQNINQNGRNRRLK